MCIEGMGFQEATALLSCYEHTDVGEPYHIETSHDSTRFEIHSSTTCSQDISLWGYW